MLEALRDPLWQFVGVLLTLVSIGVAFWIFWLQRQTKELAFGLLSSRRLLTVADELTARVRVELDGQTVANVHLLVFGLRNSGHRAVAPSDFERYITLSFAKGRVLSAEVASQVPQDLGAELSIFDSRLELRPLLLNPGDQLVVQVLISSSEPAYEVQARILDVPSFAPVNTRPRLPPLLSSGIPVATLGCALVALGFFVSGTQQHQVFGFAALTAFLPLFGITTRLIQDSGRSARRRISEA